MFDIQLLDKLREYFLKNLGLNFSEGRNKELYEKMEAAKKSFNFEDTDIFIEWLINSNLNSNQTEKLATFLTIGETYFLREKKALDYLEFDYLPKLIHERREKEKYLKIWSAGCSSGEEPYSLAIILKRILPDIKKWNITIKATDINSKFIEKAKKGLYTKWSFRGLPQSFKVKYFKELEKGKYMINPDIKEMVDFSFLNLMSDDFSSNENNINSFDIILCRNVLIYFSNDGIKYVTSKFYKSLAKGGALILSPVESNNLVCSAFNRHFKDGVTVYKKEKKDTKQYSSIANLSLKNDYKFNSVVNYKNHKKREVKCLDVDHEHSEKVLRKNILISNDSVKKDLDNRDVYAEALNFFRIGDYERAEKIINNEISTNRNIKLHLLLAKIKSNKRQLLESEKLCLHAINLDKINAEAHYLLATVLFELGKEKDAIESLNRTIFLEPDYVMGYFLLGNIYRKVGNLKESENNFDNALKSLAKLNTNDMVAELDVLTAGRLEEIIYSIKI